MRARLKAFTEGETWPSRAEACAPARRQGCGLAKQLSALEGDILATYVTLDNFTDQGLRNIKDTVKPTEAAKPRFGLHTLTHGNVRAQTMRAFTAAEMEKILEKVS